jgi:hypothetical protein
MHQLDTSDRDRRMTELLETKHHSDALLDAPIFKYFNERCLVSAGSEPSAFISRTAR